LDCYRDNAILTRHFFADQFCNAFLSPKLMVGWGRGGGGCRHINQIFLFYLTIF
jgi:hypothetical protein